MSKISTHKKIGRPKADNPKSESIRVRIDSDLFKELTDYCLKENITKTEVVRSGVKLFLETNKTK